MITILAIKGILSLLPILSTMPLLTWSALAPPAATITVTTTIDELNTNSACSLREAIQAANLNTQVGACPAGSSSGTDIIAVPAGTYILTRTGADENAAATGDLDVTGGLKIVGAGAGKTFIDSNARDRVFDVRSGATLTLASVTIQNGKIGYGASSDGNGGGIYNNGKLILNSIIVSSNAAEELGGGIYNAASRSVTMRNSTVSGNGASVGAGIFNAGTLKVTSSMLKANSATDNGGGIRNDGILQVFKSTISGNHASDDGSGGGIENEGTATLTNSTVSSNRASYNGGGITNGGTLTLYSSTITLNGGGTGGIRGFVGSITLANSIVAGNTNDAGRSSDCYGAFMTSHGYNLIGNADGCAISGTLTGNVLNVAAKLGPLQNNGGPTFTHALQPGSPAIDAGNPATPGSTATACPARDQRDVIRPQDGNGDGTVYCDIGAVERKSASTP